MFDIPEDKKNDRYYDFQINAFFSQYGRSELEILNKLGEPDSTHVDTHNNKPTVMKELYYEGLMIKILKLNNSEIFDEISITSSEYRLMYGIQVGMSYQKLNDALNRLELNKSDERHQGLAILGGDIELPDNFNGPLYLHFFFGNQNKLKEIRWTNDNI